MHNVVKWPNILKTSCGVNTTRFLKYVWPFYNIMHERVKATIIFLTTRSKFIVALCYKYSFTLMTLLMNKLTFYSRK